MTDDKITEIFIKGYDRAYTVNATGLKVRELELSIGLEKPFLLALMTDSHIRSDERVLSAFENTLSAAAQADFLIMLGDNIESSSRKENVEVLVNSVFDKFKNLVCVIGNHEKFYGDEVALRKYVDSIWPHDTRYYSKTLADKIMLVAMDNNEYYFTSEQCEKFEADIAFAKEKGFRIILLTHVRFDCLDSGKSANGRMQKLIYTAGDVLLASFSGHSHRDEYHEYSSGDKGHKFPAFNIDACDSLEACGNILFLRLV